MDKVICGRTRSVELDSLELVLLLVVVVIVDDSFPALDDELKVSVEEDELALEVDKLASSDEAEDVVSTVIAGVDLGGGVFGGRREVVGVSGGIMTLESDELESDEEDDEELDEKEVVDEEEDDDALSSPAVLLWLAASPVLLVLNAAPGSPSEEVEDDDVSKLLDDDDEDSDEEDEDDPELASLVSDGSDETSDSPPPSPTAPGLNTSSTRVRAYFTSPSHDPGCATTRYPIPRARVTATSAMRAHQAHRRGAGTTEDAGAATRPLSSVVSTSSSMMGAHCRLMGNGQRVVRGYAPVCFNTTTFSQKRAS